MVSDVLHPSAHIADVNLGRGRHLLSHLLARSLFYCDEQGRWPLASDKIAKGLSRTDRAVRLLCENNILGSAPLPELKRLTDFILRREADWKMPSQIRTWLNLNVGQPLPRPQRIRLSGNLVTLEIGAAKAHLVSHPLGGPLLIDTALWRALQRIATLPAVQWPRTLMDSNGEEADTRALVAFLSVRRVLWSGSVEERAAFAHFVAGKAINETIVVRDNKWRHFGHIYTGNDFPPARCSLAVGLIGECHVASAGLGLEQALLRMGAIPQISVISRTLQTDLPFKPNFLVLSPQGLADGVHLARGSGRQQHLNREQKRFAAAFDDCLQNILRAYPTTPVGVLAPTAPDLSPNFLDVEEHASIEKTFLEMLGSIQLSCRAASRVSIWPLGPGKIGGGAGFFDDEWTHSAHHSPDPIPGWYVSTDEGAGVLPRTLAERRPRDPCDAVGHHIAFSVIERLQSIRLRTIVVRADDLLWPAQNSYRALMALADAPQFADCEHYLFAGLLEALVAVSSSGREVIIISSSEQHVLSGQIAKWGRRFPDAMNRISGVGSIGDLPALRRLLARRRYQPSQTLVIAPDWLNAGTTFRWSTFSGPKWELRRYLLSISTCASHTPAVTPKSVDRKKRATLGEFRAAVAALLGRRWVDLDEDVARLGLDSLALVEVRMLAEGSSDSLRPEFPIERGERGATLRSIWQATRIPHKHILAGRGVALRTLSHTLSGALAPKFTSKAEVTILNGTNAPTETMSIDAFLDLAQRIGRELSPLVTQRKKVFFFADLSIYALANLVGLICIGAAPLVLSGDGLTTPSAIQHAMSPSGVAIVVGDQRAQDLTANLPGIKFVLLKNAEGVPPGGGALPGRRATGVAFRLATSGSTGVAEVHACGERATMQTLRRLAAGLQLTPEDRLFGCLPLSHVMGFTNTLLMGLVRRLPLTLCSARDWAERPRTVLQQMGNCRATIAFLPMSALNHACDSVSPAAVAELDLRSLRVVSVAGEALLVEPVNRFRRHFAPAGLRGSAVAFGYGLTECGALTQSAPQAIAPTKLLELGRPSARAGSPRVRGVGEMALLSSGRALAGVQIVVVDGNLKRIPDGRSGRIMVRCTTLSPQSRRRMVKIDGKKYFPTGDLGVMQDGELYVLDRVDDVLIKHGKRVAPLWVESIVRSVNPMLLRSRVYALSEVEIPSGRQHILVVVHMPEGPRPRLRPLARRIVAEVLESTRIKVDEVRFVTGLPRATSFKLSRRSALAFSRDGRSGLQLVASFVL